MRKYFRLVLKIFESMLKNKSLDYIRQQTSYQPYLEPPAMTEIARILSEISHRPFVLPDGRWKYYQEWNDALFFHWTIPFEILRRYIPPKFNIDRFNGKCYISLVAFTMQKIRPRFLPSVNFISDFDEINLRTYIDNDGRKGVYFLNIEAGTSLSVFVAKALSGLPYEKANISRMEGKYNSVNELKKFYLKTEFEIAFELGFQHPQSFNKFFKAKTGQTPVEYRHSLN